MVAQPDGVVCLQLLVLAEAWGVYRRELRAPRHLFPPERLGRLLNSAPERAVKRVQGSGAAVARLGGGGAQA